LSSDYMTGYYGSFTQLAVENFQCALNIVCSGSPATTGWGTIGPRTYAALKGLCRTSPTISKSEFSEWPTEGPPPLMANFGYIGGTPQGTYTINFGDGGVGVMASGTACASCVVGSAHNAVHTYTADGIYTATLSDSSGNVLGMATITVTGLTGRAGLSTGGATWGVAPFSVPFAYYGDQEDGHTFTIDYGDGSSGKMSFISGPTCSVCGQRDYYGDDHTYTMPGTYTATLRDISGAVIGTSTVTIESPLPG
jgi:PKD repeat protein